MSTPTGTDRSQPPSKRYPLGVAVCGTPITEGLFVFTNEMRVGKVRARDHGDPEWFDVVYRDGSRVMQNPERVATRFRDFETADWMEAEERAQHHDFQHSHITGDASCRYCHTIGIGDDEDLCAGVKTYLDVDEDFRHEMPFSEACVHLGVAGKVMTGSLVEGGMAQLWTDEGEKFSFPITAGEAGLYWDSTRGAYYYYREGWES